MPGFINIAGEKFGRLTVLECVERNKWGNYKWACQCECGNTTAVWVSHLRTGSTQSCGCFKKEVAAENNITHGMAYTSTYRIWNNMIQRCTNANIPNYKDYGGRGIKVCDQWLNSFEAFLEDMGEKPEGLTLERIDNSKGYEPDNCRWATRTEQARNRRSNRMLTWAGKTQCVTAWAEELGLPKTTMMARLRCGWSTKRIFTTPASTGRSVA